MARLTVKLSDRAHERSARWARTITLARTARHICFKVAPAIVRSPLHRYPLCACRLGASSEFAADVRLSALTAESEAPRPLATRPVRRQQAVMGCVCARPAFHRRSTVVAEPVIPPGDLRWPDRRGHAQRWPLPKLPLSEAGDPTPREASNGAGFAPWLSDLVVDF